MDTAIMRDRRGRRRQRHAERGFSLLEVLISMCILTVGLVSLLAVFGLAMASTQTSREDMTSKQLANEALESIITARNTSQISWDAIQNTGSTCSNGSTGCGIFPATAQPIYQAITTGPYAGILGTSYDVGQSIQSLQTPGADGIYGTADDVSVPMTGFTRTIVFSTVNDSDGDPIPTLRGVTVTVQFLAAQTRLQRTYSLNSFISEYQ